MTKRLPKTLIKRDPSKPIPLTQRQLKERGLLHDVLPPDRLTSKASAHDKEFKKMLGTVDFSASLQKAVVEYVGLQPQILGNIAFAFCKIAGRESEVSGT